VTFGGRPRVREIGDGAFFSCPNLTSFAVPSSVVRLGTICFCDCTSLADLSFCPGSELRELGHCAVDRCRGLRSISLPSSVEKIEPSCFSECANLEQVIIPEDSKLVSIGNRAFAGCRSLRALVAPASLDSIGSECFDRCSALTSLTFASPSHVRTLLSLPYKWSAGRIEVPDSVETLSFIRVRIRLKLCTVVFRPDSRLSQFKLDFRLRSGQPRSFVHWSSWTLKRFRSDLEFA
jgi:hypothetical protein